MSRAPVPAQLGNTYELEITGLSHEGHGVGRYQGFTVFVPGALERERITAKITEIQKRFAVAELIDILEPSDQRIQPECGIYEQCGGCQLQHLSYQGQLNFKERHVRDVLQRIGHLDLQKVRFHPIIGMQDPWRYRNKAQVPVGKHIGHDEQVGSASNVRHDSVQRDFDTISQAIEKNNFPSDSVSAPAKIDSELPNQMAEEGGLIAGFYRKGTHEIVDFPGCQIQHSSNEEIILKVRDILRELHIPPYVRKDDSGCIRHIIAKISFYTGDTMIVLVTRTEKIPNVEHLTQKIRERIPHVTSIMQNIQPENTSRVMGFETRCLWGQPEIYDRIGNIEFAISAESFYQVNPIQTEVLYSKALEYAQLNGDEIVIDAYCGVGTISLFLAQSAKHVYGIEIVKEAIRDAKKNAERNGIRNTTFITGKAEVEIPRLYREGVKADVIVVDPPRKGCDEALLATISEMRPDRVVYVSCNPSTLARDLRYLEDHGYQTVEVQPVDMFPHTAHVECVVRIYRKE